MEWASQNFNVLTGAGKGGILLTTVFRPWIKSFINLIYPLSCLVCKVRLDPLSNKPLCAECWKKIEFNLSPFCRVCGKHLPAEKQTQALICRDCQQSSFSFTKARAVCVYEGVIKECIHLLKYNAKMSLGRPLQALMIDFARRFLEMQSIDMIIPVPLHSKKRLKRQFNQAEVLAKPLSRIFAKQLKANLLFRFKSGPAQISLSRQARFRNVAGCFKVKSAEAVQDKHILLVDDVLTTGATANECARTLLISGARQVDVFTLARGR